MTEMPRVYVIMAVSRSGYHMYAAHLDEKKAEAHLKDLMESHKNLQNHETFKQILYLDSTVLNK